MNDNTYKIKGSGKLEWKIIRIWYDLSNWHLVISQVLYFYIKVYGKIISFGIYTAIFLFMVKAYLALPVFGSKMCL